TAQRWYKWSATSWTGFGDDALTNNCTTHSLSNAGGGVGYGYYSTCTNAGSSGNSSTIYSSGGKSWPAGANYAFTVSYYPVVITNQRAVIGTNMATMPTGETYSAFGSASQGWY